MGPWIAITSLFAVALLCLFIVVSIYVGTVAGIVVTALVCTLVILGVIVAPLWLVISIMEQIERDESHGR